jgi:hypothetical protein
MFATIFENSHQIYTAIKTRFIRSDVAAVDVQWEMGRCDGCPRKSAVRSSRIVEFYDGEERPGVADRGDAQPGLDGIATH